MRKATYHRLPKGSPLIKANKGSDLLYLGWIDDQDLDAIKSAKDEKLSELGARVETVEPATPVRKPPTDIDPDWRAGPPPLAPKEVPTKVPAVAPPHGWATLNLSGIPSTGIDPDQEAPRPPAAKPADTPAGPPSWVQPDTVFDEEEKSFVEAMDQPGELQAGSLSQMAAKLRRGERLLPAEQVKMFENAENIEPEVLGMMPDWWNRRAAEFYDKGGRAELARAASRAVFGSRPITRGYRDPGKSLKESLPFVDTLDVSLKKFATEGMERLDLPKREQEAAAEGVVDVKKKRQHEFRQEAMRRPEIKDLRGSEREAALDNYSRALTNPVINNYSPPGLDIPNIKYVEERLRDQHYVGGNIQESLPEEVIQRSLRDYQALRDQGAITESGGIVAPWKFWSAVWGGLGGKGGSKHATPVGELIDRHLTGHRERAERAAKDWKEHVGKRAANVDAQDSQWAKQAEVLYNFAKGYADMWKGLWHLVGGSDEEQMKMLKDAYRAYLVDNRGGRPLFEVDVAMLEREQNKEAVANVFGGFREHLKRMFTDTEKSLKGDPFGFIANMVLAARLINGGLSLGARADAKIRPATAQFLAKADNLLTGVPQALSLPKKILPKSVYRRTFGDAKLMFTTPSRIEQVVARATSKGEELGTQAAEAMASVKKKVDGGAEFETAFREAINEAPDQAGEFLSGAFLEQTGMFHGATDINLFLGELKDKKAVLTAYLDNDVTALINALPDEMLQAAGMKPAFAAKELIESKGKGHETILVDSTIVEKQLDDALSSAKDTAEVKNLLTEVGKIQTRLRGGERAYVHPLMRPHPELLESSPGSTPAKFSANPDIDNRALLIAMAREAKGRPIPVTINTAEKTFFEGPLVGPKELIDSIPVEWRTRLPVYVRRRDARSPLLVEEIIESGGVSDLALYLQRAKRLKRTNPKAIDAFERLEDFFEEKTGIPVSRLYEEARLGGLTHNADTVMELVVRRSSKVPGAPSGVPGLYGIPRPLQYAGVTGAPVRLDVPKGRPFDIAPHLTARQRKVTKAPRRERAALEKMEQERMEAAQTLRENGIDIYDVVDSAKRAEEGGGAALQIDNANAEALVRAVNDEPLFTPIQQESMAAQVKKQATKADASTLGKALMDKEALVQIAQEQVMAVRMRDELRIGDDIAKGGAWDERTVPLLFSGSVSSVSSDLMQNQKGVGRVGNSGPRYVKKMELEPVTDVTRRFTKLGKGDYTVPGFVNDAFRYLDGMRQARAWVNNLPFAWQRGVFKLPSYVGSLFKRVLTSLNPPTGGFNAISNTMLRTLVDGNTGPGLAVVLKDIRTYRKNKSALPPEKRALIEAAEEAGVLDANVVADDLNPNKMKLPSEKIEEVLGSIHPAVPWATGIRPLNVALRAIERVYGATDPLFKLDHIYARVPGVLDNVGALEKGKSVWLNPDKNLWRRVIRGADGELHLGTMDGPVVSRDALVRMVAKDAALSANRLYFDYSDVARGYTMLRGAGVDGLFLNPFVTWAWKALYLPMVKGGLAKEIMRGGRGVETDSPKLLQKQSRSIMGRELWRFMVMNSALAASRDEDMKLSPVIAATLQWGASPFFGSVSFGKLDSWVTSRAGINAAGVEEEFMAGYASLFRDVPVEMNDLAQPWEHTGDATGKILERQLQGKMGGKIGPGNRGIASEIQRVFDRDEIADALDLWRDMAKWNPQAHKKFIYDVRSAHPIYEYNTFNTLKNMFQMKKPAVMAFAEYVGDKRIKPGEGYAAMMMYGLLGSKFLTQLGRDGLAVMSGDKDPSILKRAFGVRKIPNKRWINKARWLAKEQVKRYKVEHDFRAEEGDTEEVARGKRAWSILANIVSQVDGNVMSNKLGEELKAKGVNIITDVETSLYGVLPTYKPVIPARIRKQ